jgi:hypothetical protein
MPQTKSLAASERDGGVENGEQRACDKGGGRGLVNGLAAWHAQYVTIDLKARTLDMTLLSTLFPGFCCSPYVFLLVSRGSG